MFFDADMATTPQSRLELEQELRIAVRDETFYTVYQPIVELATMLIVAVEALARWPRPVGQQIGPDEFIPVLEDTRLILPMGRMILARACRDGAHWHRLGHPVNISVNVSALQPESDDFMTDIPLILTETGLPANALIIEITESALIKDPERGAQQLRSLRTLGVKVSIDDSRTGYSSLDQGEALIATLIGIAQTLSIHTLAEGIETRAQLAHLAAQSCEFGQG